MTGEAVKVTEVPMQNGLDEAEMETPTGRSGLTIIITALLVAGLPEMQACEEASVHVMASLFNGV